MEEFRSNRFVLGQHPWISNSVYLPLLQVLSGPQSSSDTTNFILETFRPTEHECRGFLCGRTAAQEVTEGHRGGGQAARTREQEARKGLTILAKPLGTFFSELTVETNLSSKPRG